MRVRPISPLICSRARYSPAITSPIGGAVVERVCARERSRYCPSAISNKTTRVLTLPKSADRIECTAVAVSVAKLPPLNLQLIQPHPYPSLQAERGHGWRETNSIYYLYLCSVYHFANRNYFQ